MEVWGILFLIPVLPRAALTPVLQFSLGKKEHPG